MRRRKCSRTLSYCIMKKLGGMTVQKMYKRLKNRVMRRKGVEVKKLSNLISSEPLTDLRTLPANNFAAAADSSSISRHSGSDLQCPCSADIDAVTTAQTTVPHGTLLAEQELHHDVACVSDRELSSRRDGPCPVVAATPSCSTSTAGGTLTVESRTRQPFCTSGPMLSADSGVEVDCLESCCSYADVDDVFTDDEDLIEDDGWRISAHDVSLDKVLNESSSETVYSGYWHGSVEIHSRRSTSDDLVKGIASDVDTLSSIRHENIQLFLGVCHDLHSDYISIVMDQTKGQSLHSLVHRRGHQFSFQSATKIMSQIAQGLEYLHAKGISHPLLTSRAVTVHYRVCISMLTPCGASQGLLDADDVIYCPPEVVRTIKQVSSSRPVSHSHGVCCSSSTLEANEQRMITTSANVFSFGTLVYEMMTMERPFAGVSTNLLIWEVGNGKVFTLQKLQEGCRFRQLVSNCWRANPAKRPSFEDLLLTLENNMSPRACGLKSPFSFSEPSQLAKLGL